MVHSMNTLKYYAYIGELYMQRQARQVWRIAVRLLQQQTPGRNALTSVSTRNKNSLVLSVRIPFKKRRAIETVKMPYSVTVHVRLGLKDDVPVTREHAAFGSLVHSKTDSFTESVLRAVWYSSSNSWTFFVNNSQQIRSHLQLRQTPREWQS